MTSLNARQPAPILHSVAPALLPLLPWALDGLGPKLNQLMVVPLEVINATGLPNPQLITGSLLLMLPPGTAVRTPLGELHPVRLSYVVTGPDTVSLVARYDTLAMLTAGHRWRWFSAKLIDPEQGVQWSNLTLFDDENKEVATDPQEYVTTSTLVSFLPSILGTRGEG